MDYAQAVAKVLVNRITESRTTTARGTVTAVGTDGFITFTDATGGTRKGVAVSDPPAVGEIVTFLDEGRGIPIVLGAAGKTGAWTSYTAVWSNGGSAPTLGNGTLVTAYRRYGRTLHLRGQLRIGSTTSVGSGDVQISLPTGMAFHSSQYQIGSAAWYNADAGAVAPGICLGGPSFTELDFQIGSSGQRFQAGNLAVTDDLQWGGTFELAA